MELKHVVINDMKVIIEYSGNYVDKTLKLKEFVKSLYNKTCSEFGILNPIPIRTYLFRHLDGNEAFTLGRCKTYLDHVEVFFHAGYFKVFPEDLYKITVPHEISHTLVDQIFPERKDGHGQEWKEMMQYFKLPPDIIFKMTNMQIDAITYYGEI